MKALVLLLHLRSGFLLLQSVEKHISWQVELQSFELPTATAAVRGINSYLNVRFGPNMKVQSEKNGKHWKLQWNAYHNGIIWNYVT